MNGKNVKIAKRAFAFKGYSSSYDVGILNYFNPELQHKDTEPATKNKLKKFLTELRGFKFVATLVLRSEKIENDDKTKYNTFYSN